MKNELISVIIPVYNVERYLRRCLDSVCNQTYKNLDIILINDGSTDNSATICDEYANRDRRITVVHKENGGLSDARNVGMRHARGSLYCFIDSDDFIMPKTIEEMYYSLIDEDCDIAVCNMIRVYEDGESSIFYQPSKKRIVLDGIERFQTLKQPSVCNKMFKSSLFEDVAFPNGRYYEDTFIYHILAYRSCSIVLTGYDGYRYFCRKDSIVGQQQYTEGYFDFVEAVWMRATYLVEHNVEYYKDEACLSLYRAYANARRYIPMKNKEKLFKTAETQFSFAYDYLMNLSEISLKQKFRLFLLKHFPFIHGILY